MSNYCLFNVVDEYVEYKIHRGLSKKTCKCSGKEVINISRLSNHDIVNWDRHEALKVYYCISKLPVNLSANKELNGLRGDLLLKKADELSLKRISFSTEEKYLRRVKEFFDWLVLKGISSENYFLGLKPRKKEVKV
ncbi:hypothetical protein ACN08N_13670 [Photobacterium leiognathi subsp. mandapamensis]|uniref:hypothetical protein n=1 Tax=Photobacterium leiognathi TaxID=553611 RepID=UPI003AF353DF